MSLTTMTPQKSFCFILYYSSCYSQTAEAESLFCPPIAWPTQSKLEHCRFI